MSYADARRRPTAPPASGGPGGAPTGRPDRSAGAPVTVMAVVTDAAAEPVVPPTAQGPDAIVPPAPIAPRARSASAERRRRRSKRHTGRRLFQFDRGLGVRWIAGADEAGRGCLAASLVAAAVLLDMESLGVRGVR